MFAAVRVGPPVEGGPFELGEMAIDPLFDGLVGGLVDPWVFDGMVDGLVDPCWFDGGTPLVDPAC